MIASFGIHTPSMIIGAMLAAFVFAVGYLTAPKRKNVSAEENDFPESRTTLFSIEEPTAREINDHAMTHGVGIMLARSQLRTVKLLKATSDARTVTDLRMVVARLINYARLTQ